MIDPRLQKRRTRNLKIWHYAIYDEDENYIFEGTIKEVSKYLKCKKDSIYNSFWKHNGEYASMHNCTIYKTEKY